MRKVLISNSRIIKLPIEELIDRNSLKTVSNATGNLSAYKKQPIRRQEASFRTLKSNLLKLIRIMVEIFELLIFITV